MIPSFGPTRPALLLIFAVWLSGFLSPKAPAAILRRDGRAREMGPNRRVRPIGEGAIKLDALICRCVEKDPAARLQAIAEVASILDGVLVHQPWTRSQIDAWWKQNWLSEGDPGRRFTAPVS